MSKIEFNSYDLCIRLTKDGDEVVQFKNGFDPDFISSMKEAGVKVMIKRSENGEEEE